MRKMSFRKERLLREAEAIKEEMRKAVILPWPPSPEAFGIELAEALKGEEQ